MANKFLIILVLSCLFGKKKFVNPDIHIWKNSLEEIHKAKSQTSNYKINYLLDSKIEGSKIALISSNLLEKNYISNDDQIIHLIKLDLSSPQRTVFNNFLQISAYHPPNSELKIFYTSKILNVDPLIIYINSIYQSNTFLNWHAYINIVFLSDEGTKIINYNIDLIDPDCDIITTDGLLNPNDNYIYFISVYCNDRTKSILQNQAIKKTLIKCPKYPTNLDSDCIFTWLYNETNIFAGSNDKGPLHLKDKLLISNSLGQVFIGISDSKNLDPICSNSMKYLNSITNGGGSSSISDVLPCDGTNPSESFSRFLLLMNNNTIINIGLKCSEDDLTCLNTYFTIYSVSPYPFQYQLPKKKIFINPSKVQFVDAILSLDERNIYLLINNGEDFKDLFEIASLDLNAIFLFHL